MASIAILAATSDRNLALAQRFADVFEAEGHTADVIEVASLDMPVFTTGHSKEHGAPASLDDLWARLEAADGWLVCAPEYNGSIPPVLSNAIAWLSVLDDDFRSLFNGRPIAIGTHSGGGGMEVLISMRIQLTHLGAEVIGRQLLSNFSKPAKDESIDDVVKRLLQRQPLAL